MLVTMTLLASCVLVKQSPAGFRAGRALLPWPLWVGKCGVQGILLRAATGGVQCPYHPIALMLSA